MSISVGITVSTTHTVEPFEIDFFDTVLPDGTLNVCFGGADSRHLSAPAVATANRLENWCPLLRDSLVFDPVQAPSLRHAFELVNAAILEADHGLRHQILDRARDQDFAGTRFRCDARAD